MSTSLKASGETPPNHQTDEEMDDDDPVVSSGERPTRGKSKSPKDAENGHFSENSQPTSELAAGGDAAPNTTATKSPTIDGSDAVATESSGESNQVERRPARRHKPVSRRSSFAWAPLGCFLGGRSTQQRMLPFLVFAFLCFLI